MKKTIFILIVLILSLLYYLGLLTKEETLPFSKEFFSIETSASEDPALDLKTRWSAKAKEGDKKIPFLGPSELDQLYQLKLDKGLRNIPLLSSFLIREAEKSRQAGNSDQAVEWARYAVKFSPDLPGPYYALSWALWYKNPLEIHRTLLELWKGQIARLRHYPTALQLFYNVFYILANALLMTFIVFGIVVLLKYLPLYFYDIRKNLSQEISKLLINSLKMFPSLHPSFCGWTSFGPSSLLVVLWGFVANESGNGSSFSYRSGLSSFFLRVRPLPFGWTVWTSSSR
jgi:hypothetical protein